VESKQASSHAPRPSAVLAALLLSGTALVGLHDWLGLGGAGLDLPVDGILYDAVVLGAALGCLIRAFSVERERSAWLLIGLAIGAWGLGEVYWTIYIEGNPGAPFPSPADIGYLAFYPLAFAGLAMLVRDRTAEMNWRLWADGLIATLGTAALGTAFIFEFVTQRATGTTVEVATTLAYPLGDIAMVAVLVGLVALTEWHPGRTWSLLLAGLGAMVAADIAYTLQWTGTLPGGDWVNPIYLISAVFLGIAVWQRDMATIRPGRRVGGWRGLMIPALFATVMVGLFAMQSIGATGALATTLWGMTMAAVVLRLAMSVHENRMLLEQVQTDPLTGLGNRGRMQLDLEAHCAHATADEPVAVCLFDLNGFKHYNDSFGHPAGDELLARLGRRLEEAIDEEATAYRIGGDEFSVLVACGEEELGRVATRAARALTEIDRGVEVSSSWGVARIPFDAVDPREAMQLADVRMYAQKESRRLARRRSQPKPAPMPAPRS
jgi:two-component system cell cycle response regulator